MTDKFFGNFFGWFAAAPQTATVTETAQEAAVKRRTYERSLVRERKRLVMEMEKVEAELRRAVVDTDKTRGIPLLKRFKTLEMMIRRIDNVAATSEMSTARLDMAKTADMAKHIIRINANAMHRINNIMGSDEMRAPMERLANEVGQFDAIDAEIQAQGDGLMATLSTAIEDEDVTEQKWDEWIAMSAQRADASLPAEAKPDELEAAINEIIAATQQQAALKVPQ